MKHTRARSFDGPHALVGDHLPLTAICTCSSLRDGPARQAPIIIVVKKRRIVYGAGALILAILVALMVWQGSFHFGEYGPQSAEQIYLLWAVSTLIFLLMVTLGFMLGKTGVKLYVERRANKEGSRIRTKLVLGALALSILPVFFLVVFSINVVNRNLDKWFSRPTVNIHRELVDVSVSFQREIQLRADGQAALLAQSAELGSFLATGSRPQAWTAALCEKLRLARARLETKDGRTQDICVHPDPAAGSRISVPGRQAAGDAVVVVNALMPVDLAKKQLAIEEQTRLYNALDIYKKQVRWTYFLLLSLIALFILFVATWMALFLSKQISGPIAALLEGASQLRQGNLRYRVSSPAIDELATLVRAFNEMSAELDANEKELERRRNFTEAILESIPTGVISLSAERRIQRVNSALAQMFGVDRVAKASRIEDLFPVEDAKEIHYLLNRARRMGLASSQLDWKQDRQLLHLAITVSALIGKHTSGWVVVLEDTSELLRAQKALAWQEVARRIAHELKNPLTPIALSAERITRQLEKVESAGVTPEVMRIVRQCSRIISAEVESVKSLANAFSQLARFPAAQPQPADLNQIVESALDAFTGQLDGIELRKDLAAGLPLVSLDAEQFKRVVINLVDNAAEAMKDCPLRRLMIRTQMAGADTVELEIGDTGHGISPEDRERLFLPYFSTKSRGTGLGLAIVNHILQDHGARIRVEDHLPQGARFVIEISAVPVESGSRAEPVAETRA